MELSAELLGRLKPEWDRAPGDPEMTAFKRQARRRQAMWRAQQGLDFGEHPPENKNGSVLKEEDGNAYANFLSPRIVEAVKHRLHEDQRQTSQQLQEPRLLNHLLSSMPMCFNLYGELHNDPERLTAAGKALWNVQEEGQAVKFEWSPGRHDARYTGDGTAFDVALFFGEPGGASRTVIGIETKYHEHAVTESEPNAVTRLPRYTEIAEKSQAFKPDWRKRILGTELQQVWRDHLLLLAMLQDEERPRTLGTYVLVYPEGNTSFARLAERYMDALEDTSTFRHVTLESLLDAHVLHARDTEQRFRDRYLF
ncbi:PGN_0703 family putative restriction endonuclease [Nocardioides sp. Soil805]|uniref:PGN_0703 family putative restriction endonuclease n=1 Tax=Nocardioides sp. Soil805 TaxID=1736416 RepID=UPI000703A57D|nr:hypothetical protein [Nocardioides sp. Soil805]KRF37369.1 hypothetical protein ASG94_08590 [Nocardioides sp. Soil805]